MRASHKMHIEKKSAQLVKFNKNAGSGGSKTPSTKSGSGAGYRLSQIKTDQLITNSAGYKDNPLKRPANWVTCVADQDSDRKSLLVADSSGYLTSINRRGALINQKVSSNTILAF